MNTDKTIFQLFNGIRPMARELGEPPSNVASWKSVGRIPAEKQPHVLAVGLKLGLPITAENVVFPLGRPNAAALAEIAARPIAVACDQKPKTQRKDAA